MMTCLKNQLQYIGTGGMGVARIFFGGGGKLFQKIFKKICKKFLKNFQKYSKKIQKFLKKISKIFKKIYLQKC